MALFLGATAVDGLVYSGPPERVWQLEVDSTLQRAPQGAVTVGSDIYATTDVTTTSGLKIVKSTDGGATWAKVVDLSMGGERFPRLATDGVDTLYVMAENGVFRRYTGLGGTLDTSLTVSGGTDPDLTWVDTDTLVHAYITDSGTVIRTRTSTDDGDTWGSAATVATAASGTFEDLRIVTAADGSVLLHAENEIVDLGESSALQWRSTDNGATWGSALTLAASDGTTDHEGGDFAVLSDGTVVFTWPHNGEGGDSYDDNLLFQRRSTDHGVTYAAAEQVETVDDEPSHVAVHTVAVSDEVVLLSRRFHDYTGTPPYSAGAYAHNLG